MNNDRSSAETLENNFLSGIITSSIFLVAGISLIRFTDMGPIFAVGSLIAAFLLFLALIIDYFIRRSQVNSNGESTRILIDILAYILIPVLVLIVWMSVAVWRQIDWKNVQKHFTC